MNTTKPSKRLTLTLIFVTLVSVSIASHSYAQDAKKAKKEKRREEAATLPAVLWRDPGNIAMLNLIYGAGGMQDAPSPADKYTFVQEDMEGTSPKFDVDDEHGVRWKVKLGQEPQSETAATRLLWAAGYFVDEDYYLSELKVTGLPKLRRGSKFVSADGMVHRARLERKSKDVKKLGNWDWFSNPFANTRELNGLRIMMALLNNWDLKDVNNSIYIVGDERRFVVSDVGATFGNTGSQLTRSKSKPNIYARSRFIARSRGEQIDFVMHDRPFFLSVFDVPHYVEYTRMERVTQHIPLDDAKWLGARLSQLSDEQLRDCFRAAGYTPDEIALYTDTVRGRIADLVGL